MIYEILNNNGDVINTIVADESFILEHFPDNDYRLVNQPNIITAPVWEWYIDLGPFYDRFGAAKMPVLTSNDSGVKAIITDLNIRKWVDLKRSDVAEALQYVATIIPTLTPALQSAIINTPVSEVENIALRRLYFS